MKLLFDQNLPRSLAAAMANAGYDVVHTEDAGLQQVTDPEVFEFCIQQSRVLVTADKKLTKFLASTRATMPSVVILRGFAPRGEAMATALMQHLAAIETVLADDGDAVFSIGPDRPVRVQRLPLGIVAPT